MSRTTLLSRRRTPSQRALCVQAAVAVSLIAAGCSTVRNTTGVNAPEPQLGKTGTGALTGAAVGGGLGLLVGSTAGSAGEGLLVGSLAGSALGAGIGAKLERDDRNAEVSSARSKVNEQNELIDQQNRQLDRMRGNGNSDSAQLFDSSQLGEEVGIPRHTPRGGRMFSPSTASTPRANARAITPRLGAASQRTKHSAVAEQDVLAPAPASAPALDAPRGQLRSPATRTAAAGELQILSRPSGLKKATPYGSAAAEATGAGQMGVHLSRAALSGRQPGDDQAGVASAPTAKAATKAPAAAIPFKRSTASSALPPAVGETKLAESSSSRSSKAAAPREASPAEVSPKEIAPKDQADCKEAVKEAERGLHATADADRLFYLRRAARLCPGEAGYHVELGKLYSTLGKNDDAKFEFRQAIDLDPNNAVARDELSIVENAGNISR